jgi:hypothetical protein
MGYGEFDVHGLKAATQASPTNLTNSTDKQTKPVVK